MNLQQKSSRYSDPVLFAAGLAGALLVSAVCFNKFRTDLEIWLACALVLALILYARTSFALSRAQQEVELMRDLLRDLRLGARRLSSLQEGDPNRRFVDYDAKAFADIGSAIEHNHIELYLQPVVSLPERNACFLEAYFRMRRNTGGPLFPSSYLDAAERAGRINTIDNMILLGALKLLREVDLGGAAQKIFCNLSPATLFDQQFFTRFADYLDANRDMADRIIFEIPLPAMEMIHAGVKENLTSLADRGFSFSVDHVNRSDINWRLMETLNFRFVKAPRNFLLGGQAQAVKAFGRRLTENEITLIAECVGLADQEEAIVDLGIEFGQGALFGAPMMANRYIQEATRFPKATCSTNTRLH